MVGFTGTKEQCFLLGYRAISREYYTKKASSELTQFRKDLDKGRDIETQSAIQKMMFLFETGLQAGMKDIQNTKDYYDDLLVSKNFNSARAYIIELAEPPTVMCSGAWMPQHDLDGKTIQDLLDLKSTA